VRERLWMSVVIVYLLLWVVASAHGQGASGGFPQGTSPLLEARHGLSFSIGLRKYVNSFTSYEFRSVDAPVLDPISRLEWPWDQVYGVVRVGAGLWNFRLDGEWGGTLVTDSGLKAQDSDWEDVRNPRQKTTFSQADARPRGWTLDFGLSFPVPKIANVRGLAGYRRQQFGFTYTDGLQRSIWDENTYSYARQPEESLPGPTIQFDEHFTHYYAGGILSVALVPSGIPTYVPLTAVLIRLQADGGRVFSEDRDHHLIRENQPNLGYISGKGYSWHVRLGVELRFSDRWSCEFEGDFMRIRTEGTYRWLDSFHDVSWEGGSVWSEQKFVSGVLSLAF
jgi:hypothetical protein